MSSIIIHDVTLGSRSQTKNFYVSFCTEDFRSLLGCLQINLLETWYGERCCFKVFISNISTYNYDLGVKGHRLRILMLKILLKFLGDHYFFTFGWI